MNKTKHKLPLALDKNSKFVYKSGSDVMATWKKYGWIPPSEKNQLVKLKGE